MIYKTAMVVGASSGIGAEIVRQLAQSGVKVAALARRGDRLEQLASEFPGLVIPYVHDVTETAPIPILFQEITTALGGLDLFIYSSGVMSDVEGDEYSFEKDKAMIDVNITGAVAWLNVAGERFGRVGYGSLVAIGSVAGERGRFKQPVYNASKAFLATYMESLRNRLSTTGVNVVTIKPGPTDTEMTRSLGFKNMMSAHEAAQKTIALSHRTGEHFLKLSHRVIFGIIRSIPSGIFRHIKI